MSRCAIAAPHLSFRQRREDAKHEAVEQVGEMVTKFLAGEAE